MGGRGCGSTRGCKLGCWGPAGRCCISLPAPFPQHHPRGRAIRLREKVANPGTCLQLWGCCQRSTARPGPGAAWYERRVQTCQPLGSILPRAQGGIGAGRRWARSLLHREWGLRTGSSARQAVRRTDGWWGGTGGGITCPKTRGAVGTAAAWGRSGILAWGDSIPS